MATQSTFQAVALSLARVLSRVQTARGNQLDEFANLLLTEFGWDVNDIPQPVKDLVSDVDQLVAVTKDISSTDNIDYGKLAEIAAALVRLIDHIGTIGQGSSAGLLPSLNAEGFLQKLQDELLPYLIVESLRKGHPLEYSALRLLGLVTVEQQVALTAARSSHVVRRINWSNVIQLLTAPKKVFEDVYGWGTPDFDALQLGLNIADFLDSLGFSSYLLEMDGATAQVLEEKPNAEPNLIKYYLKMPFALSGENAMNADFGLGIFPLPQSNGLKPGFAVLPYGNANVSSSVKITDQISFAFETALQVAGGIGLVVRPDQDIKIFTGFQGGNGAGAASGAFKVGLLFTGTGSTPIRPIAVTDTKYVELQGVGVHVGADLLISDQRELFAEFELRRGKLAIGADGTDGFLSTVLPAEGITANFDLVLGISTRRGVYFRGSGGLEIQLPTHVQLGPIELQSITVSIPVVPNGSAIPLSAGASVKLALGPMQATIEGIGLAANLSLPGSGGNLGPIDLTLGFKPPNGVGLAIDAGVVKGGGFLRFDPVKEEYDGVLELDLSGLASVKAIGLISTRLPDGSKGFSLLLILTAAFGSPIQLGFGFTLSAVGGLLGLNRTMRLEVIATGIRDGGINSVMFPQNVVQNASRIISDLKNYFPVEADTFLIGPMAMIGWGTPNLVTVSLGIIIEIPGDIAILGVLRVVLPDEDAALIVIQVNFIGAIEFDKKRLWFFAAMFESRVLFITLEGEMGLLVGWGDDASFVVSVGGFHPAFNPPPLPFGAIARLAISILDTDFARIRVEGYFAVTSNSVQFGAAVEIYFGISAFNIDGHLAFDALFRFSPFYFIISISASLSVKVFGIGLFSVSFRGSLEGPTPWHVEGTGSISILFFDIDVDFSYTWGNEAETTLPPISVVPLLVAEVQKLENWRAALPPSNQLLVTLRSLEQGSTDLVLHPVGSLKISQRAVPLGMTIDKVGNQKPSDANCFEVTVTTLGIQKRGDLEEPFAVGQYLDKSDGELLSAQSFAPIKSGVELSVAGEQYHAPVAVKRVVRYEEIILDTHYRRFLRLFYVWSGSLFALFLNGNAASKSVLSHKQQQALKPFADKVQVGKPRYSVTFVSDNTAFSKQSTDFTSQAQAEDYMKQQTAKDGRLARQIHVIPQVEMQRAA